MAIYGDRIVAVGSNLAGSALKTVDARSCIVTPGFIDVHDHSDYVFYLYGDEREQARGNLLWCSNQASLLQGVTTVVSGNCGYGFPDMNEYYTFIDSLPFGSNTCYLTPHGFLREDFGNVTDLTPSQMEILKSRVAREMEKGAIGMSTGLGYVPGINATKAELIELGKVLKKYDGIYVSHIQNEPPPAFDSTACPLVLDAILEAIDIGRQAGIPVQISHIKAYIGGTQADYDNICTAIESARREGIDVTADQYPFTAAATTLSVLAPAQYRTAFGIEPEYWNDPVARAGIRAAIAVTFQTLTPDRILIPGWDAFSYKYLSDRGSQENGAGRSLSANGLRGGLPGRDLFYHR